MICLQHLPSQPDGGGETMGENPQGNFNEKADTIVKEVKAKEVIQERALSAVEEKKNGDEMQIEVANTEQRVPDQRTKDLVVAQTKERNIPVETRASDDDKENDGGGALDRSLKLERPSTLSAVIKGSVFTNLEISSNDNEDNQRERKEDIKWIDCSLDLDTSFQFKPIEESKSFKASKSLSELDQDKSFDIKSGSNSDASTFSAFVDRQRTNASSDADDEGSSATDEVGIREESTGSANGTANCHDNDLANADQLRNVIGPLLPMPVLIRDINAILKNEDPSLALKYSHLTCPLFIHTHLVINQRPVAANSALLEGYRKAGQENAMEALNLLYQTRHAPGGFSVNKVDKNGMRDDERLMCLATLFSSDTSFQFFQNYFSGQSC